MAYLDGELPVDRAAVTATHLQECRECQILAAELKSVSEGLTAWEIETKESEINADLAKALDERENSTRSGIGKTLGWTCGDRLPVCAVGRWRVGWRLAALAAGLHDDRLASAGASMKPHRWPRGRPRCRSAAQAHSR